MSLLSGQELESLGSILSCPGPSLCYVPGYALERDEVSRKMSRNLGMTSAFTIFATYKIYSVNRL